MTNDKKADVTIDMLIADVMLRITSIEALLIEKGVFTQEELNKTTEEIAKKIAKIVLDKAQAGKNMNLVKKDLDN